VSFTGQGPSGRGTEKRVWFTDSERYWHGDGDDDLNELAPATIDDLYPEPSTEAPGPRGKRRHGGGPTRRPSRKTDRIPDDGSGWTINILQRRSAGRGDSERRWSTDQCGGRRSDPSAPPAIAQNHGEKNCTNVTGRGFRTPRKAIGVGWVGLDGWDGDGARRREEPRRGGLSGDQILTMDSMGPESDHGWHGWHGQRRRHK
jgi:hypothetical protein